MGAGEVRVWSSDIGGDMLSFWSHGNACSCLWFSLDTPSQRVQFILGTEDDDEEHIPHDLFTELDEICWREGEDAEWRETARWGFLFKGECMLKNCYAIRNTDFKCHNFANIYECCWFLKLLIWPGHIL